MRVRRVEVKGLFGVFHHVIPLRMNERVTIIHGPNGFGKTVLLEMIHASLRADDRPFRRVPFEQFSIEFDNGEILSISSGKNPVIIPMDGREETPNPSQPSYPIIDTRLIQTRRLDAGRDIAAVELYSNDLGLKIRNTLTHYAKRAQELDRSFPTRLLREETIKRLSPEELQSALVRQENKRTELIALGILDAEEQLPAVPPIKDDAKLEAMSIYVHDVDEKLSVFDELAAKLRLFVDVLRNRFQYKTFSIHRDRGIVFYAPSRAELPIKALSSGEQHELVMLYDLLFIAPEDSLILIDEPELSLHLLWQQPFLDDLLKIAQLSNVDVLLATHSPDLIGAHWNLTEALKGPDK